MEETNTNTNTTEETTAKTSATYEDIKKAVFYSQQKPEMLADILAEALGVEKEPATDTE